MLDWVSVELSPPALRVTVALVPPVAVEAATPPVLLTTDVLPLFASEDFPPQPVDAAALTSAAVNKENVQVRINDTAPGKLN
jgi:hypothetical protein